MFRGIRRWTRQFLRMLILHRFRALNDEKYVESYVSDMKNFYKAAKKFDEINISCNEN